MIVACRRPVLIVEGPGDVAAVPLLLRSIAYAHGVYDFTCCPNPIKGQNLPKLSVSGALEKFTSYALSRDDGDSVLICVDTDGQCPKTAVEDFRRRLESTHVTKKVGLCFFHCEFEALFIACLDKIATAHTDYGWHMEEWSDDVQSETIKGAKGYLTRHMKRGRAYKEIRDQGRFVAALDSDRLRLRSRAFRHLEKTWRWLAGIDDTGEALIAPVGAA